MKRVLLRSLPFCSIPFAQLAAPLAGQGQVVDAPETSQRVGVDIPA